MERITKYISSERGRLTLYVCGGIVIGLLIFHAGMAVGAGRCLAPGYAPRMLWGFHAPFGDVRLPHGYVPRGHGAIGTVTGVATSSFMIEDRDGDAETVRFGGTTRIQDAGGVPVSLAPGDHIVALGAPADDDSFDATFIRIVSMPTSTPQ